MDVVDFIGDKAITRGDDWSQNFQFKQNDAPMNITGWTFAAQMRTQPEAPDAVTILVTPVDASIGVVRLSLSDAQTAVLRGVYLWDLERTVSGVRDTAVGGKIIVNADITRV